MKIVVFVFAALLCFQLAAGFALPGLFGNIFKPITNTFNNVVKTVTDTSKTIVTTTTDVFSNTADAIADATKDIPIVGAITETAADAVDAAQNVIDTTADAMADATKSAAQLMTDSANNVINDVSNFFSGTGNCTAVASNIDSLLSDILSGMSNGDVMPANLNNLLSTVQDFSANFFGAALPAVNNLIGALNVANVSDLITAILNGGLEALGLDPNTSALLSNITELLGDAAALAALPFLLKIQFKLLLIQAGLNLLNQTIAG